jgi:hypothetical protein
MMRTRFLLLLLPVLGAVLLLNRSAPTRANQITNPQPVAAADELQAVTLIFGSKDIQPSPWDGSVSLSQGKIERLAGYHFNEEARIAGTDSWVCSSYAWGAFSGGMHPNEKPQPHPTAMQTCGVVIYYRAPPTAEFHVKVQKGEFTFRPTDIPQTEGIFPLGALVEVYRSAVVEKATTAEYEDDFPSLAADGDRLWLAWVAYRDKADRVFLRSYENGAWGNTIEVTDKPGDIFGASVAVAGGKPLVIWSEREESGLQLKARSPGGLLETITSARGNHLFHRAAADARGNLYLVWQSFRGGRSDIYGKSLSSGRWSAEVNLSDGPRDSRANDWNPSVAITRDGTAWVAWDGYATGSYNIYLRPVRGGKPGELIPVTGSPRFHAHPNLAVDAQDRLWVAWDESRENWGKDTGFLLAGGTGLLDSRSIRMAVFSGGRWMAPLQDVNEVVPYGIRRFVATPRLVSDSAGRMWLFLRPRTNTKLPTTLWAAGGKWEAFAAFYDRDRWSELLPVPESVGRNEGEISVAADRKGNVYAALVTDHRLFGGPNFSNPPANHDVMLARLRAHGQTGIELGPRGSESPASRPTEPREREQIRALRAYTINTGGKQLKIYRGDMHRHTEISQDGAGDGSLFDAYRYAIDAAGMDYLAVTDHQSGQPQASLSDYPWWRIQKSADMFHNPGFFTALFGTERSLPYPNGHRNLIFARRGVPILFIKPEETKALVNSGSVLYPFLRQYNGIATSHTSHTTMGTDWRDNDAALEPIVEIFQGARTSAEQEGAPLAPTVKRTELWAGGYRPLGFVANAWAKGYKLGVQASSDHVSTHLSYAYVLAENPSREALVDAMRQRHTYAATSNILLDYRMSVDGSAYLQGDAAKGRGLPELSAHLAGSAPIRQVVVVRDNQVVYSQQPNAESFDLRFRETALSPGEHFYYVRLEQVDGNVAWSSPIWITR